MERQAIILASTSPRRRDLLRQIGVRFEVLPSGASEDTEGILSAREVVRTLAARKGEAVASTRPEALVIAADTVVALEEKILGKPEDSEHARRMLKELSGRTHEVITAVAFYSDGRHVREVIDVTTEVTFADLPRDIIERYVATGEPLDKAGSYGIQGAGAILVRSISGSYSNVAGLPLHELAMVLRRLVGNKSMLSGSQQ